MPSYPRVGASGESPSDPGRRAADLLATSLGRGAGVVDIGGVVECGASPKVGSEEIRRPTTLASSSGQRSLRPPMSPPEAVTQPEWEERGGGIPRRRLVTDPSL